MAFSLGASAIIATFACGPEASDAAVLRVAVAANFAGTHEGLAQRFSSLSGVAVSTSSGSTGQLYAQIRNGAPYHVFLAADEERPRLLEEEGAAVPGTRFTYALGRLALVGFGADSVRADGRDIAEGRFVHLAVANPDTAPYGAAAMEVLQRLGLDQRVAPRIVFGESVAQVHQFVRSGAAELGFVALAQLQDTPPHRYWLVPVGLHAPLRQDAVLLAAGAGHEGARGYLRYLRGLEALEVLTEVGYGVPPTTMRR